MKKNLLTAVLVLGAAPLAMADMTFQYQTSTNNSLTLAPQVATSAKDVTVSYSGGATYLKKDTAYASSFYAAYTPLNSTTPSQTWTLDFTATAGMTLSDIELAVTTFTSGGGRQTQERTFDFNLVLSSETETIHTWEVTGKTLAGNSGSSNAALTLDFEENTFNGSGAILTFTVPEDEDIAFAENTKYKLQVTMTNQSSQTYAGIAGVNFKAATAAVPEPATATLSLLALAGLAARRRRK